jgi:hypothetical protein
MAARRARLPRRLAGTLYDSIQKVLALPDEMRLFMCHDYGPNGRDIQWETTVAEEKAHNIHVGGGKTKEEFVKFRTERDAQLGMPKLIIPSLQVNMRAGEVPTDKDGNPMLKVPVNVRLDPADHPLRDLRHLPRAGGGPGGRGLADDGRRRGQVAEQGTAGYAVAALTLAVLSGGILLAMGLLKLGFLANFLSHPVIAGFITASGILIAAARPSISSGIEAHGHSLPRSSTR